MVITVTTDKGTSGYVAGKERKKAPVITIYRKDAWNFDNLHRCANIRDDVLEYYKGAAIVG